MVDTKSLSIYEVRTTISAAYNALERISIKDTESIKDSDIREISRIKDDLRHLMQHYWTINNL